MTAFRIALSIAVAMAATGCPVGDPTTPPPPPIDGPVGTGLTITWNPRPEVIPGQLSPDLTIDRVELELDDLRVLGEAGTFQLDQVEELEWAEGVAAADLPVPGALPGSYVRLSFALEGDEEEREYAYEIKGKVRINGVLEPFTIRDTGELSFGLDFSITLSPGGSATIPVRVEADKIVEAVDFQSVTPQNGVYLVGDSHPQLPAVRAAVNDAFGVHGPS